MSKDRFGTKYDRWYAAVITPFKENREVDEDALRKLLQYFMQPKFIDVGGGIIINPEAGELTYLSRQEKRRNVEIAMEECGGKVPVFAGVIDLRTEDSVKVAVDVKEVGADGLFLMPPMGAADVTIAWQAEEYPEVWIDMAKAQVEATDLPAIVHPTSSIQPFYGIGLPLGPSLKMCKEIPNIIGWKMVYNHDSHRTIAKGLRSLGRHIGIFEAPGTSFHESLASDIIDGSVTGCFCYAMEIMVDHINAWKKKDLDEARRIWDSGLADLHDYVFIPINRLHTRYKVATWLRGLIPNPFQRPPMPRPRQREVTAIRKCLTNCGYELIPDEDVQPVLRQLLP
jgi:4-hydroxy-tetrahydrodipicolinate synthase